MASPSYTYEPRARKATGAYRDKKTGQFISDKIVISQLDRVGKGLENELGDLAEQLQAGEISTQEWYDMTRGRLKILHGTAAAASRGGFERMTPSDWDRVGGLSKFQYDHLNQFVRDIEAGKPNLYTTDDETGEAKLNGFFLNRAKMYGRAGRSTYWRQETDTAQKNGKRFAKRRLGRAEHCHTSKSRPGCVELAGHWVPIAELVPIGSATCLSSCKCGVDYAATIPTVNIRRGRFGRTLEVVLERLISNVTDL